ncbi:MAG: redoxin domain-containing protein [Anaerolineae bacterium]|nr:redoxin domain-containing protein [Anaerolineae bacterium]
MGNRRAPGARRRAVLLVGLLALGAFLSACGTNPPQAAVTIPAPAVSTPPPTATWVPMPTDTPVPTATPSPAPASPTKLAVAPLPGALAPDFVVSDLEGNPIQLSAYRGKRVLLNFWATWCPPCRYEMPALQEAYTAFADDDFVILGINYLEAGEDVRAFMESLSLTFPVGIDSSGEVFRGYRVVSIPTSFFINRDGVIIALYRGPLTREAIEQALAKAP